MPGLLGWDESKSLESWERYFALVAKNAEVVQSAFAQSGFFHGSFETDLARALHDAIGKASGTWFSQNDYARGYLCNAALNPRQLRYIRQQMSFKYIDTEFAYTMQRVVQHLSKKINEQIGPFRMLNVRAWTQWTGKGDVDLYSNKWHTDEFPSGIYKLLVFPHELNSARGSLMVRRGGHEEMLLSDEMGNWVLFENSLIMHRGVLPDQEGAERYAVELTLCKSAKDDHGLVFAGNNAKYPFYPWMSPQTLSMRRRQALLCK